MSMPIMPGIAEMEQVRRQQRMQLEHMLKVNATALEIAEKKSNGFCALADALDGYGKSLSPDSPLADVAVYMSSLVDVFHSEAEQQMHYLSVERTSMRRALLEMDSAIVSPGMIRV